MHGDGREMAPSLSNLEDQLKRLVEGSFARLQGPHLSTTTLSSELAGCLQSFLEGAEGHKPQSPDHYMLYLHPEALSHLADTVPDAAAELARGLGQIAKKQGMRLLREPQVLLVEDPEIAPWEVHVDAWVSTSPLEQTHNLARQEADLESVIPQGAYLIINGERHFPLDQPVINIGRRQENELTLDSRRVSRNHAQLRAHNGRYVLFDLNSTAGTQVNGLHVQQHILRAGDVIRLSDVDLVYGEDLPSNPDSTLGLTPPPPPQEDLIS